jgi:hypothetical protein
MRKYEERDKGSRKEKGRRESKEQEKEITEGGRGEMREE